jgi:hypothetical protein
MNASHAFNAGPDNLHQPGTSPVHPPRTVLLVLYAALVAQLAIWSSLAAHAGFTAAFIQAYPGAEASLIAGGAIWLVQFTIAVAAATIRYRRHHR